MFTGGITVGRGKRKIDMHTCCMSRNPSPLDLITLIISTKSANYEAPNYKCSSLSRYFVPFRSQNSPPNFVLKYLNST
jgi:hypothetical protein